MRQTFASIRRLLQHREIGLLVLVIAVASFVGAFDTSFWAIGNLPRFIGSKRTYGDRCLWTDARDCYCRN